MSRLQSLMADLPQALSKDAAGTAALSVSYASGATFVVSNLVLSTIPPVGVRALNISLKDITLSALATSINANAGYAATVLGGLGAIKAYTLVEATYAAPGGVAISIPYFTSANYRLMAPLGVTLDTVDADWSEALRQTDLRRASGVWLDRIGLVYGVTRTAAEPDTRYARRIALATIAPKCNGYAMTAILINALGAAATIADTGPAKFSATLDINLSAGNPYDTGTINTLLNTYKAFGTTPTLVIRAAATETDNSGTNSDSLVTGINNSIGEFGGPEFGLRESGL